MERRRPPECEIASQYAFLRQAVINASVINANSCERAELVKIIENDFLYAADRYYGADYSFLMPPTKGNSDIKTL